MLTFSFVLLANAFQGGHLRGSIGPRQVSADHSTEDPMTAQTVEKQGEAGCGVGKVVLYFQD